MENSLINRIRTKSSREISCFMLNFYLVGLAGTIIPFTRPVFLFIFPFAILLSLAILLMFTEEILRRKTWIITGIIAISGYLVEVAGVGTGLIFGEYTYGTTLGLKFFGTPLMIGINWALLVLATASVAERFRINVIFKITGAAAIMVFYDIFLEITAGPLGMWYWEGGRAPLKNYAAWFLIAVLMHTLLKTTGVKVRFRSDIPVLAAQIAYFILLSVWFTFAE